MLPFDVSAIYQSILALGLVGLMVLHGTSKEKLAAGCAALWLVLSLIAQDLTHNMTPALMGIVIGFIVCYFLRESVHTEEDRWLMRLHDVVTFSMLSDLMYLVLELTDKNEVVRKTYQHLGAFLFLLFITMVLHHSLGNGKNDPSFSKLHKHIGSRRP